MMWSGINVVILFLPETRLSDKFLSSEVKIGKEFALYSVFILSQCSC